MIRINLLPKEDVPRSVHIKVPAFAAFIPMIVAVLVVGLCAATFVIQSGAVSKLNSDIKEAQEESQRLAPQIARIKQLTKERDEVDRRLDAITQLDRDRYFRVHLLSDVARKLPENMWLTLYEEVSPNSLRIEGITFSNFVVADLLRDQVTSEYYRSLDLEFIERGYIGETSVLKFGMSCSVGQPITDVAVGL